MTQYLNLFGQFFKASLMNEFQYRANFFVQLLQSGVNVVVAIGGLAVVFEHTDSLNGWSSFELLAVVGVYFIISGFIGFIIEPSMQRLMEGVQKGTLDFTLVKPEDSQLLISMSQVQIWRLLDVLIGGVALGFALTEIGATISFGQVVNFVIALIAGGAIVYSFWLMLATCTFWLVRFDNILEIFNSVYEAGRFPVGVYPTWMQFTLTFIVPVAFAVTVPSEALTGRLNPWVLVGAVVFALVFLGVSRAFWQVGSRHYSGASA